MKIKHTRLVVKNKEKVMDEFRNALSHLRKGEKVAPHRGISFETIDTLRKIITPKRLELLHMIKQHSPQSIYELAKLVNRDLKSVNTDIQILADFDMITLEEHQEERKKVKPIVHFDKLNVEITI